MFKKIRLRHLYTKYKSLIRKAKIVRLKAQKLEDSINTPKRVNRA